MGFLLSIILYNTVIAILNFKCVNFDRCKIFILPVQSFSMYYILLFIHNLFRWIILLFLLINIIRHFTYSRKHWTKMDNGLGLVLMIVSHITLLIGLYQWGSGPYGFKNIQAVGFGAVMRDSASRFWAVEHITGMLIAIILITIGKGVGRKAIPSAAKHRKAGFLFLTALIVILIVTPWPGRTGIGRPLNPLHRLENSL
jgi:hypothetical protein